MTKSLTACCVVPVVMIGVICGGHWARADEAAADSKDPSAQAVKNVVKPTRGTQKKTGAMTPDREALVVDFAKQHHPELATLLQNLKSKSPPDYQAALGDLDRTVDRLLKSKDKNSEKYDSQLATWKNLSRVRLLEAKLAVTDDQAIEGNLRTELNEQLKLKLTAQEQERDRLQKRLEKLNQSIEEMKSHPDNVVDQQIIDFRKKLPAGKPAIRTRTKKSADSMPSSDK